MLSDLRESGTIEQDADVVLFIWRNPRTTEDDRDEAEPRGIELVLILAKQRNGPTGDVSAIFMKPYAKFVNMEHSGYDADAIHVP
jgi:replicative DNA helicase